MTTTKDKEWFKGYVFALNYCMKWIEDYPIKDLDVHTKHKILIDFVKVHKKTLVEENGKI